MFLETHTCFYSSFNILWWGSSVVSYFVDEFGPSMWHRLWYHFDFTFAEVTHRCRKSEYGAGDVPHFLEQIPEENYCSLF